MKDNTLRTLFVRGAALDGSNAGFGHFNSNDDVTYKYAAFGFRTVNVI